jgi:RIO-like serine/threonine protein kinase
LQTIAHGLAAIHAAGVCHGDVYAHNVLVRDPEYRGQMLVKHWSNTGQTPVKHRSNTACSCAARHVLL